MLRDSQQQCWFAQIVVQGKRFLTVEVRLLRQPRKVTLKMTSVFPTSLILLGGSAVEFAGTDLTFNFFTTVPFGPDAPEFLAWIYHGGGLELSDEMFGEHNIKAIPCGIIPPEASGWLRKGITSLDDLKGMKMRFFGLGARVMDKLRAATR